LDAGRCEGSAIAAAGNQKRIVKPEAAITVFEHLMMGAVSPETCWAIKKHRNNKFYYKVPSCWFFLWDLYYDTRIHEHHIGKICCNILSPICFGRFVTIIMVLSQ